jgi:hypothetical protein
VTLTLREIIPQETYKAFSGIDETNIKLPKQPAKILNDDFSNTIPDPNKGGQYIRTYTNPVSLNKEEQTKINFEIDKVATEYLNTHDITKKLHLIADESIARESLIMVSAETFTHMMQEEAKIQNEIHLHDAVD